MAVPGALGLDPTIANSVHRLINKGVGSILPSGVQSDILYGIFTLGRAQSSETLLNENNPLGPLRLANLRRIFEEGKSLQLQFPAEDLGFRYLEGALIPDHDGAQGGPDEPTGRRRDYIPNADPGSRLPHMNVRILSDSLSEATITTLDLISGDRVEFLLIIAPIEPPYHFAHAALKVAEEFKVSARVCVLWPAGSAKGVKVESKASLKPWENYIDVMEVKKPSNVSSWWDICQMTEGAILVRPDGV